LSDSIPQKIVRLKGDGSERMLFRIIDHQHNMIGVYGPNAAENKAFVSFSRHFRDCSLPVPDIYAFESDHIYFEQDLGDTLLCDVIETIERKDTHSGQIIDLYQRILEYLIRFQIIGNKGLDYSLCYQTRKFSTKAMLKDLDNFHRDFLTHFASKSIDLEKLHDDFQLIVTQLTQVRPAYFMYRDFQSRNIMLQEENLYFIDYQSGRKGALQYDVASLLFDANVNLSTTYRDALLSFYLGNLETQYPVNTDNFMSTYYDFALIRVLQALAAFSRLGIQKGMSQFTRAIPAGLENIRILLKKDGILQQLSELRRVFEDDILQHDLTQIEHH